MSKQKVVLAYSGGLDTTFCALFLSKELGYEIHAIMVDTGGYTADELESIKNKALSLGIASYKCVHITDEFYQKCIKYLIMGNVLKNNTYPLSVSAERVFQAIAIAKYAKEMQADAIAHGSTGAGNDQVRFDLVFNTIAPKAKIITPIRDYKFSREYELDFLKKHGVEFEFKKATYSLNVGIWGTSVGGKETLSSHGQLPEEAYPTQCTATAPLNVELTFEKGELKAIDGTVYENPVEAIHALNAIAGPYAIGRDIHVGDTIIGIKGRVGFEAAAPYLIIKAHHLLEKHTLTKWQQFIKTQLADWYGTLLHEGQYLDPTLRNIEAFFESSQEFVCGKVFVTLHPYHFQLNGIESAHDLMSSKFGAYGEENKSWSGDDVRGFAKILGNQLSIFHKVNGVEF